MLTAEERAAIGADPEYCLNHVCGPIHTDLPSCSYRRVCMCVEICGVQMFLRENPEPHAGEFSFYTANALCDALGADCRICPMVVPGEYPYCAFGFDAWYEEENRVNLDFKPDPEKLQWILELITS